jgi:HEPN domain-containing protein
LPQREGRDLALVLLRRADGDVALVRHVLDAEGIPDAIVGVHAQQAVEKALKAVLAAREIDYTKTHALGYLLELLLVSGIEVPSTVLKADELNPWAVEFRYEADSEPALDRHSTLALVESVRAWAGEQVERAGG